MFNYTFKFTCSLFLLLVVKMFNCQESPCPRIFQYKYDYSGNNLYGLITVPTPTHHGGLIALDVQLSIGNSVNRKDVKEMEFLGNADDVVQRRPLVFRIEFPPWNTIPPQVTSISINNKPVCFGEPVRGYGGTTTVNLVSTVTITNFGNPDVNTFTMNEPVNNLYPFIPNSYEVNRNRNKVPNQWRRTQQPNYFDTNPPIRNPNEFYPQFSNINSNNRNPDYNTEPTRQSTFNFQPNSQNKNLNSFTTTQQRNPVKPVNYNNDFNSCGKSMMSTSQLIANGNAVKAGAHPWIGALFLKENLTNPKFLCGASLITKKLALTAGHCVAPYNSSKLYLTFGRILINDWLNENVQNAKIEKCVLHPEYNDETSDSDIAILYFINELIITTTVKPICLWDINGPVQEIVDQTGVVVGWGKNENDVYTPDLREIYIRVVSEEDCLRASSEFNNITSSRTFCAGNMDNSGPCNGDSGSGFYFYINERWTIRGIVSRSLRNLSGRCDLSKFSVYVDVAKYIQWIQKFL